MRGTAISTLLLILGSSDAMAFSSLQLVSTLADGYARGEIDAVRMSADSGAATSGTFVLSDAQGRHGYYVNNAQPSEVEGFVGGTVGVYYQNVVVESGEVRRYVVSEPALGVSRNVGFVPAPSDRPAGSHDVSMCSGQMRRTLRDLSNKQQRGVNSLFKQSSFDRRDWQCLIAAIRSTRKLRQRSFVPPYPSTEGIYHHGFPTQGDLVAYLLPHLAKCNIYPATFPMGETGRRKLALAWTLWFSDLVGNHELQEQLHCKVDVLAGSE